jgi:hypothetical protein
LTLNRSCGSCTLCCKLLPVKGVDKPAHTRCQHQFSGGCRIYSTKPQECSDWSCVWRRGDEATVHLRRPDRSHYIIDMYPDLIRVTNNDTGSTQERVCFQVWLDLDYPDAWKDKALLHFLLITKIPALVRLGSHRAFAVFPPGASENGQWNVSTPHECNLPDGALLRRRLAAELEAHRESQSRPHPSHSLPPDPPTLDSDQL